MPNFKEIIERFYKSGMWLVLVLIAVVCHAAGNMGPFYFVCVVLLGCVVVQESQR